MTEAVLGLGSNMGSREKFLSDAISMLSLETGKTVKRSSVWETEPWGFDADTPFYNMAISVQTELEVEHFLRVIHSIEARLGRERYGEGYKSRTIDIDILFWGDEIITREDIVIPHPHLSGRLFVLAPLNEILPDFVHPGMKLRVSELLSQCADNKRIKCIGPLTA